MATLLEIYNLAQSQSTLRSRVSAAVADCALDVLNEDPGTTNHADRVVWAKQALIDPTTEANRMFWGVLGNATIQASGEASTDNDILYVVAGLIDVYAG